MISAQTPRFEEMRLADLRLHTLYDIDEQHDFDEIRALAASICDCAIAYVSFVDRDRQLFVSKQGVPFDEIPRSLSFCSHTIALNTMLVVEDLAKDERFFNHPMVTGEQQIRFYAGAPIKSPTGYNLGALCVIDVKPRVLNALQTEALQTLANQITRLLEYRMKANAALQEFKTVLSAKNEVIAEFINYSDRQKDRLAKDLHEHVAQDLAATQLYLSLANNQVDNKKLIEAAQVMLNSIMDKVKEISYNYSSSTLETASLQLLMENLRDRYSSQEVEIQLHISGDSSGVTFMQSLSCVRIIDAWIQVLLKHPSLNRITIDVAVNDELQLAICDDAASLSFADYEQELFSNALYYRVIGMNGKLKFEERGDGLNELHIQLPIVKAEKDS